ncbi:hypothetical protein [Candidatus Kinetoplastidibacterium crithidiae]|uniref:Uncharacterized protein n=1 Tax=Candidatus Kinetoplastidibacterium crithidiae TCC036E TaxID=1208918 RepID=M1LWJ2_9PROT|nr:hypothetical protein [Candidatus Kinetoplastibacterium crithidii]AFZ82755.1 hypothetical protein CKCE_0321 [Candidatus Kinetoplastibacterium crithidii (ex Angomonas deanei ATCC 30255)]AGF47594.1 hypothetical protein CDEE_0561 [Candidatus Kinetoplastibacterium crithidii TCC036E]
MLIVIPGFFPPNEFNININSIIKKETPYIFKWLKNASINYIDDQLLNYGCTAFEAWQIKNNGFVPDNNQTISSALGPLFTNFEKQDNYPIWLLELVNIEINTSGVSLSNPYNINLAHSESLCLLNSIKYILNDYPFKIEYIAPQRWRIFLPDSFHQLSLSPYFIFEKKINVFSNCKIEILQLRKLLNDVQMFFHNHEINIYRESRGLKPINFLWLYGGAKYWNPKQQKPDILFTKLYEASISLNYDMWIYELKNLEYLFKTLSKNNKLPKNSTNLVLLGHEKCNEYLIHNDINIFKRLNIFKNELFL